MMQIGAIVVDLIVIAAASMRKEVNVAKKLRQPRYQRVIDHVLHEAINGASHDDVNFASHDSRATAMTSKW